MRQGRAGREGRGKERCAAPQLQSVGCGWDSREQRCSALLLPALARQRHTFVQLPSVRGPGPSQPAGQPDERPFPTPFLSKEIKLDGN